MAHQQPVAISTASMRKMRSLFAGGVTVVTTALDGQLRGMTVSAFAAVSLDPPLILVALANEATTRDMIAESRILAVNILSDEQEFLSERFAARAPIVNESFEGVPYRIAVTGAPILPQSLAWYDCRTEAAHEHGDHTLILGRVHALGMDESRQPLVYFANRYRHLRE